MKIINRKLIIGFVLFTGILLLVFKINVFKNKSEYEDSVIKTGMTSKQEKYFSDKLSDAVSIRNRFDEAKNLRSKGVYDKALMILEEILADSSLIDYHGMAVIDISNTYEKKRDYGEALEYTVLLESSYVGDWAKEPVLERIKYLEYASQGKYDLAVRHAELAMQAEMKVHGTKKPRIDYIERLNDLKASKEYIESLKTKQGRP